MNTKNVIQMNTTICIATPTSQDAWVFLVTVWVCLIFAFLSVISTTGTLIFLCGISQWPRSLRFVLSNVIVASWIFGCSTVLYHITNTLDFSRSYLNHVVNGILKFSSINKLKCLVTEGIGTVSCLALFPSIAAVAYERWRASCEAGKYVEDRISRSSRVTVISSWAFAFPSIALAVPEWWLPNVRSSISICFRGNIPCVCPTMVNAPFGLIAPCTIIHMINLASATSFFRWLLRKNKMNLSDFYLDTTTYSLQRRFQLRQIIDTSAGVALFLLTVMLVQFVALIVYFGLHFFLNFRHSTNGFLLPWTPVIAEVPKLVVSLGIPIQSLVFFLTFKHLIFKKNEKGKESRSRYVYTVDQQRIEEVDMGRSLEIDGMKGGEAGVPSPNLMNVSILQQIWNIHESRTAKITPQNS